MAGFDQGNVFHSIGLTNRSDNTNSSFYELAKAKFTEFIETFKHGGFDFFYRDILKRNCKAKTYFLQISLRDLISFDETLTNQLISKPDEYIPIFEEVLNSISDVFRKEMKESVEKLPSIQILMQWDAVSHNLRDIKSEHVSKLIKIDGIVIATSSSKLKAVSLTLQCHGCQQFLPQVTVKRGLAGYSLPRKCTAAATGVRQGAVGGPGGSVRSCPIDPYFIVPDKSKCIDYQTVKLQEAPENVPHGEMPRTLQLYCDGYLCDQAVPGNRVTIVGIYSTLQTAASSSSRDGDSNSKAGVCPPYIRVMGIELQSQSHSGGLSSCGNSSSLEEEAEFRAFASRPELYSILSRSIAPGIYGSDDIKKAICCLLFGGSRKRMADGLYRRGDVNMLMLGDPGTAKSQLLKFVEKVAPIAVYTSGKGSSAAGLTASINRDPSNRNFVLEGGAMVLADGGVVCIDEFDKMREDDRVAIHEAMEQQTISIAKAGITTMLNSRCSVLAAANSVHGHYDDTKEPSDNIDFMPTILSRFDMIFLVKDRFDESRDLQIANHVLNVHINNNISDNNNIDFGDEENDVNLSSLNGETGVMSMGKLKRYVAFCRRHCGPRITKSAVEKLLNQYVMMRSGAGEFERQSGKKTSIPLTVRQLEALVRLTESLAKMRLSPFATEADVDEAIRLFQVSTLNAALSGTLEGVEGFTSQEEHEMLVSLEKLVKKRFVVGSQVSEQTIVADLGSKGYQERAVVKVLQIMVRRGEVQPKMQRKLLLRIK